MIFPDLLMFLLLPAVLSAAPIPADNEKPKPRPRLTGTLSLPVHVDVALWHPDSKHLILRCSDGIVRVIRRDQFGNDEPTGKPISELKLPPRSQHIALSPEATELYSIVTSGGRLTAECRAYFWNLQRVVDENDISKADRVVSLESEGTTTGLLVSGGRQFLIPFLDPRRNQQPNTPNGWPTQGQEYTARFERLSAKTGDRIDELAKFDDVDASYSSHAVDPKVNRLIVQLGGTEDTTVRCLDVTSGKQTWERKLPGQAQRVLTTPPVFSRDGQFIGIMQSLLVPIGVPQQGGGPGFGGRVGGGMAPPPRLSSRTTPVVLNARTGEPVHLVSEEIAHVQLFDFSADGRLLVGQIKKDNGVSQVVVWDTTTGKLVKFWNGRGEASVSFAPSGHEVMMIDHERKDVYGPTSAVPQGFSTNGGQQWTTQREIIRTDYKSTLGIWDLSPLVK